MRPANFSYVVEGILAASGRPRTGRNERSEGNDLDEFAREGFAGIVSLTERPLSPEDVSRSGFEYLHLPVRDFSAPALATVRKFVDFVRQVASKRGPVLVHCGSGYGRSGTMAACYLVCKGLGPDEAIAEIRRLRPGSVETVEQEETVRAWARDVSSQKRGDGENDARTAGDNPDGA